MNAENKKVLLVEDETTIATLIKRYLGKAEVTVLEAADGKAGLDIALKEKPDLILLDLSLPIVSGVAFLEILRKDPWGKDAVVVALTNSSSQEVLDAAQSFGVKEYIIKSNWAMDEALNRALIFIGKKIG